MNEQSGVAAPQHPPCENVENGRPWHEWRRMDEDQPAHSQRVLFWFGGEVSLGIFSSFRMRFYVGGRTMLQAFYWMPLPPGPEQGGA